MNNRGTLILLLVTGVVALAATFAYITSNKSTKATETSALLFPDLMDRINDVAQVKLSGPDGSINVVEHDGTWILPEKTGVPAVEAKVRQLIIRIAELEPTEAKTANPDLYSRINVEDSGPGAASTLLTLADAEGNPLASLILGKIEWQSSQQMRYVRRADQAQTWLVKFDSDTSLDTTAWAEKELTRIDGSRIQSLIITQATGHEMGLSKSSPEQEHYDVAPIPEGRELRSPGAGDPLARGLQQLNFDDVREARPQLGLATNLVFQTFDGLVISMRVVEESDEKWAQLSAESIGEARDPEELAKLQKRFEAREFEIPAWAFNNLNKRVTDLLAAPKPPEPEPEGRPLGPILDPNG